MANFLLFAGYIYPVAFDVRAFRGRHNVKSSAIRAHDSSPSGSSLELELCLSRIA
jgi:hypothetical protein